MHPLAASIALALTLTFTAPLAHADSQLDPAQQQSFVATHDRWRAEVGVPGVSWSASLGAAAQEWADHLAQNNGCNMRHATRGTLGDTGENLYWAGPVRWSDGRREAQTIEPAQVVDSWGSEIRDYDAARNRCAPGKACGHYTQIVWRDSREIGCAMAQCADFSQVWVCRYSPAGNYVGRRPY